MPLVNAVAGSIGLSVESEKLAVTDVFRVARYYMSSGNHSAAIWYACGMSQIIAAQWISYFIFHLVGMLPLYVISFVLSSVWFIDVAKFGTLHFFSFPFCVVITFHPLLRILTGLQSSA